MVSSIVRSTVNRGVHLRITPRPVDLGQSREILRLISEFGEVEYYKNLRYDELSHPNTALAIFKDDAAAVRFSRSCPLRFRMGRAPPKEKKEGTLPSEESPFVEEQLAQEHDEEDEDVSDAINSNGLPRPPGRKIPMPHQVSEPPAQSSLLDSRVFQISCNPARVNFRFQIDQSPYHGPFMLDTKSLTQTALKASVPLPGLSCVDWKAEGKSWRRMQKELESERSGHTRRKSLRELHEEREV